tara:strand:- start:610 stop:822 length:213 start_codon:yes stop_codon:yes gene_type:complete
MNPKRRARMERAVKLHEKTIASHESGQELTIKILEDKELTKTSDEVEKLRLKKLERAKSSLEQTKNNLRG